LANRLGKMLRINADGSIPADNPFFTAAAGNNRAIWALGLRNPFTFAFQPGTTRLFINDVGQSTFEEINDGIAGSNYGWPTTEGSTTDPRFRSPLFAYGHSAGDSGGFAITGGAFYNSATSQFPDSFKGEYFYADFVNGWIHILNPSDNTASNFARGIANPVDIKVSEDGGLYYLERGNGGHIFRIQATFSIAATAGASQSTTLGSSFTTPLQAKVTDSSGNPVSGALVTFTAPASGASATFSGGATSASAITDGNGLATAPTLTANSIAGSYSLLASPASQPVEASFSLTNTTTPPGTGPPQPLNISTRVRVGIGNKVMIGGLIIAGNAPKKIIVRALGPSLQNSNVNGALADPVLELHGPDGALLMRNDNWKDTQRSEVEASGLQPASDLESAIIATLVPGNYTAIVSDQNNGEGIGLVEVFDLSPASDSDLANISSRGFVETGENVIIGGFILGGTGGGTEVIVRAIGPSLAAFELTNLLIDPTLDLRDGNGTRLIFDDNWQDDAAQATEVAAKGLAPKADNESAVAITLSAGAYTAIVAGKDGGTGIGLVEVYHAK
jgi:hypothetical protein